MTDAAGSGPQRHPSTVQLLRYFRYDHLPTELGVVSMQFHHLAHELVDRLPDSPELTVALRKLLEGKDAAVRAALEAEPGPLVRPKVEQMTHNRVEQTLDLQVRIPDGLQPEQVAGFIGTQVAEKLRARAAGGE